MLITSDELTTGAALVFISYRITRLITQENGPFNSLLMLQLFISKAPFVGDPLEELMTCFYCMSVWVSLVLAYAAAVEHPFIYAIALSGVICFLFDLAKVDGFSHPMLGVKLHKADEEEG